MTEEQCERETEADWPTAPHVNAAGGFDHAKE